MAASWASAAEADPLSVAVPASSADDGGVGGEVGGAGGADGAGVAAAADGVWDGEASPADGGAATRPTTDTCEPDAAGTAWAAELCEAPLGEAPVCEALVCEIGGAGTSPAAWAPCVDGAVVLLALLAATVVSRLTGGLVVATGPTPTTRLATAPAAASLEDEPAEPVSRRIGATGTAGGAPMAAAGAGESGVDPFGAATAPLSGEPGLAEVWAWAEPGAAERRDGDGGLEAPEATLIEDCASGAGSVSDTGGAACADATPTGGLEPGAGAAGRPLGSPAVRSEAGAVGSPAGARAPVVAPLPGEAGSGDASQGDASAGDTSLGDAPSGDGLDEAPSGAPAVAFGGAS